MLQTYFSAFAALAGSVIGALAGIVTTWLTLHAQERTRRFGQAMSRREALYGDFIEEASKLYSDALSHKLEDASKFIRIYALMSKLRLFSSDHVISKAEEVMRRIVEIYEAPEQDFRASIKESEHRDSDVLRAFSEACRREMSL
jgi:hypothetical protein